MSAESREDSIRAEHLIEALPYILSYQGAVVVIKFGGHAMASDALKDSFAKDVTLLRLLGFRPVVVHGGGPQISGMLKRLGLEAKFVEGLRYTDGETMEVVEMVLSGSIGKDLVARIARAGGQAAGLSGKDGSLIEAERETEVRDALGGVKTADLGFVGRPAKINTALIDSLTESGFVPVIAPIGAGSRGEAYNINADTAAAAVAVALRARRLILLTDVPGVLDKNGGLIVSLSKAGIAALKAEGLITGGMIPKLECCVSALEGGCSAASVIDGRVPHSLLLEIFTHRGCGTEITLG